MNIPVSCLGLLSAAIFVRKTPRSAFPLGESADAVVSNKQSAHSVDHEWQKQMELDQRVEDVSYVEVNGGECSSQRQEPVQYARIGRHAHTKATD